MPKVKHIVLLKLKPGTTDEKVQEIFQAVADLKGKIPGIVDFSCGSYSSPEGLNQGFQHAFMVTFESPAARDGYLPHPDHEVVKQLIVAELDGGLNGVVAFDWEEG